MRKYHSATYFMKCKMIAQRCDKWREPPWIFKFKLVSITAVSWMIYGLRLQPDETENRRQKFKRINECEGQY